MSETKRIEKRMDRIEDKLDKGFSSIEHKFDDLPKQFVPRAEFEAIQKAEAKSRNTVFATLGVVVPIVTGILFFLLNILVD